MNGSTISSPSSFIGLSHQSHRADAFSCYPSTPCPDEEAALGIKRIGQFPVGFGGYSDVWKAEMTREGTTHTVALKVLRLTIPRDRLRKRERRELTWASLYHDNIALFYAIYHQSNGVPVFVSQWYQNGTADKYLCDHPDADPLRMIYEIASGLQYIHSRDIIHGDLKAANVLIDDGGHARLTDFGLSRFVNSEPGMTTSTNTSLRWCAPELLLSNDFRSTMPADVYAFASTALQLLTGNIPYAKLPIYAVYQATLSRTDPRFLSDPVRYVIPQSVLLWRVLESCWRRASFRPNITQVKRDLLSIYA